MLFRSSDVVGTPEVNAGNNVGAEFADSTANNPGSGVATDVATAVDDVGAGTGTGSVGDNIGVHDHSASDNVAADPATAEVNDGSDFSANKLNVADSAGGELAGADERASADNTITGADDTMDTAGIDVSATEVKGTETEVEATETEAEIGADADADVGADSEATSNKTNSDSADGIVKQQKNAGESGGGGGGGSKKSAAKTTRKPTGRSIPRELASYCSEGSYWEPKDRNSSSR